MKNIPETLLVIFTALAICISLIYSGNAQSKCATVQNNPSTAGQFIPLCK